MSTVWFKDGMCWAMCMLMCCMSKPLGNSGQHHVPHAFTAALHVTLLSPHLAPIHSKSLWAVTFDLWKWLLKQVEDSSFSFCVLAQKSLFRNIIMNPKSAVSIFSTVLWKIPANIYLPAVCNARTETARGKRLVEPMTAFNLCCLFLPLLGEMYKWKFKRPE